ncbi:conserved protein of unknown function [Limnospira indica PCC 8005]|uniref:Uncharacterized protein n=1 Tax=Limnospira indica PCC 8005 TaxID=376219 RepID=A0A9P1NXW1_9CYAN|nr:conserved protein of unknown function [Limnospira indica PCC 8005]
MYWKAQFKPDCLDKVPD